MNWINVSRAFLQRQLAKAVSAEVLSAARQALSGGNTSYMKFPPLRDSFGKPGNVPQLVLIQQLASQRGSCPQVTIPYAFTTAQNFFHTRAQAKPLHNESRRYTVSEGQVMEEENI
ncbi:MAG: hypothetical protein ABF290_02245, partial [Thiogranum sp.]